MGNILRYRLLQASWGIAIDIAGDVGIFEGSKFSEWLVADWKGIAIALRFSAEATAFLSEQEKVLVKRSILFKKEAIANKVKASAETGILFSFESVWYNSCDYQLEGLCAAVIQWIEKELELEEIEPIDVRYNPETNRYAFSGVGFPSLVGSMLDE